MLSLAAAVVRVLAVVVRHPWWCWVVLAVGLAWCLVCGEAGGGGGCEQGWLLPLPLSPPPCPSSPSSPCPSLTSSSPCPSIDVVVAVIVGCHGVGVRHGVGVSAAGGGGVGQCCRHSCCWCCWWWWLSWVVVVSGGGDGDGGGDGGWYSSVVATRVIAVVVVDGREVEGCGLAAVAVHFSHVS